MVLILNKNTFTSSFLKYMPTCRPILNLRTFDANFVGQDLRTSSANYYELLKMPFPNRLFPNLLSWKGLKKQILKCQSFQEKGHIFSFIRQQYCYIAT